MSIVQRVVLQSCVSRATALVRHSETLRRRHGVMDEQSHKKIHKTERRQRDGTALTPAAGLNLAQTLALRCLNIQYERLLGSGTRLTWASRTPFYPKTTSLSLCHPYRHDKKKNNINDHHDDCIESKLKCSFFLWKIAFVVIRLFVFFFLHFPPNAVGFRFVLQSFFVFLLHRPHPCLQRALSSVGLSTLTAKRILYKKKKKKKDLNK